MEKEYLIKQFLEHIADSWIEKEGIRILDENGKAETIKFLKKEKNWGQSCLSGYIFGEKNGIVYKKNSSSIELIATWNDVIEYLKFKLRKVNKLGIQSQLI